jgi:PAS domain S-box-containing protein
LTDDLSSRLAILETVNRLNAKLRTIKDPQDAFQAVAWELKSVSGADFAALFLLDKDEPILSLAGYAGFDPSTAKRLPPIRADEETRHTLAKGEGMRAVRFNSLEEMPRTAHAAVIELGVEKAVLCPVILRGEPLGYLVVCSRSGGTELSPDVEQLLLSISDDIALVIDNVRSADALRRSKEEMERMLSLAPIGIFTCDSKGIFRSANRQMLSILEKRTEEEIIGTSVFEIPAVSRSGLDALLMQGMEGHDSERADVHYVPRQDKAVYLHVKVTPLKNSAGQVQSVLAVAMDITSKVRLQNQLERSYERLTQAFQEMQRVTTMKTQFIDIVSHELRTPLTVMRGYIDLVESEYASKLDPKFLARLKTIRANTDKLYGLVESMLDVSRLEKGSLQIHRESVNLEIILDDVVKGRMNDAEQKKQTLTMDIDGKLPTVMADRRRMKDVFDCLLDNAIKYTPDGGRVQVSARDEGRIIHVWVKDNGVGIPLDSLGKLFDRFHIIASDDLSHQVNRLGLGLPIAKGIVEAHQGRIWVESQVGKGSVFHVDIPKEPPK